MPGAPFPAHSSALPAGHAEIPPPGEVREALDRVLASAPLARSPRLRQLLAHVVDRTLAGRTDDLKESAIAVNLFGRPSSFDPRLDSIVRLEARRLRDRLAAYYGSDGALDPIRIELPKGHYAAHFSRRVPPARPGRDPHTGADARPGHRGRFGVVGAIAVALAASVGALLIWRGQATPAPTIAILPFDAAEGDADLERFAFGVVEDITTAVASVPGLRVIARSSAFRHPGRGQDVRAVGRALGATHLMEGSVRRQDDRIRISAQLVRVSDAQHVWAETFDRHAGNAFDVQDAVAAAVAGAVSQALPATAPSTRTPRPAPSVRAYELYLEGVALRGERTRASATRAIDRFEQAVAEDPDYAPAHAALAGVLAAAGFHGEAAVPDALARARAAADRAIVLDGNLAAAHAVRAWIRFFDEWDFRGAEREFTQALRLNPSLADTHNLYALMLMAERRDREAVAHALAARDLDPLSFTRTNDVGVVMLGTDRPREALEHAYRAMRTSPTDRGARGLAGMALLALGRDDAAIREFELALAHGPRYTYLLGGLAFARARRGERAVAQALAAEIEAACRSGTGSWVHHAYVHAGLGDADAALADLRRAHEARDVDMLFIAAHPLLAELRSPDDFTALRDRVLRQPSRLPGRVPAR